MKLHRSTLSSAAAFAGLATGIAISTLWSENDLRQNLPSVTELPTLMSIDPMGTITRAEVRLVAERARQHLESGRPWAAWRMMEPLVAQAETAEPGAVLVAAQAAGEWGGWGEVRRLLRDREWMERRGGAEGWMLLARAEESGGNRERAAAAYRRAAAAAQGEPRALAQARLGKLLRGAGDERGAARAYAAAAESAPVLADWMRALQAEALAAARSGEAATLPGQLSGGAAARARQARAAARVLSAAGNDEAAIARLWEEARALGAPGAPHAAALWGEAGRRLAAIRRPAEAREALRLAAGEASASAETRTRAAAALGELPGSVLKADDHLVRAAAYEAGRKPGLAARALRAALAAGAPDTPEMRLRLGRLLFDESDLGPARTALANAAERLADPERAAEAELVAARALYRAGDRAAGLAEMRGLAERRPGTAGAGGALFLLADASPDRAASIALYRRAAAIAHSPDAPEALFRLGDRLAGAGDRAGAARAWEELTTRYPRGEQTARAAYEAGKIHEAAGRAEQARALYGAAVAAEPTSYHAVRSADRLGVDPLDRVLAERPPWVGLASDNEEGAAALRRLELLRSAGLDAEWREELDAQMHRLAERPVALLALAEGLRDAGHTVEGIRMGRQLLAVRGGRWDRRLLQLVFPLPEPYRSLVMDEGERAEVDPYLLAGVVRQESSWDPRARSRVGATGLSQIMPATGKILARSAGVEDSFHPSMLTVAEINLRMGARYLGDQLNRYDGARDLALAAYNAGPTRADRWRTELGHGGDPDRFRERIPFAETREYVQVVIRNAVLYRNLYGERRSPGLVSASD